jgi:hypothetical protein
MDEEDREDTMDILVKEKKTWLLGEFEGRWATRRQGGGW